VTESPPTIRSPRSTRDHLRYESMPLAIYRELVAHLRQVDVVEAGLLPPEPAPFDYRTSQIGGLWLRHGENATQADRDRVRQILDYYTQQFGRYATYEPSAASLAAIEAS